MFNNEGIIEGIFRGSEGTGFFAHFTFFELFLRTFRKSRCREVENSVKYKPGTANLSRCTEFSRCIKRVVQGF